MIYMCDRILYMTIEFRVTALLYILLLILSGGITCDRSLKGVVTTVFCIAKLIVLSAAFPLYFLL